MKNDYRSITEKHHDWQIPRFNLKEYFDKKNKYAICVFVLNEGQKVQNQLRKMKHFSNQVDIIVADGGSKDGSLDSKFLESVKVRTLLTKIGQGKLSAQMRMAFAYVMAEQYSGVIVIDGNDKDDVTAIPKFIHALDYGFDHVQGSRFVKGGKAINTPLTRLLAVRLIHAPLISLASRKKQTDTTNGFRAYSSKLILDPRLNVFRNIFKTYEMHYYLAIESARDKKFKLAEVPVMRKYPKAGKTPTKISPIRGNLHVLRVLMYSVFRMYRVNK